MKTGRKKIKTTQSLIAVTVIALYAVSCYMYLTFFATERMPLKRHEQIKGKQYINLGEDIKNKNVNEKNILSEDDEKGSEETNPGSGNSDTEREELEKRQEKADKHKRRFDNLIVKGLYVTGNTAGDKKKLDDLIKIANETEINALIIDVKETYINYSSRIPMAKEYGLDAKIFNPGEVLEKLHDNNIYAIARIVCFRDNELAEKRPDLAIKKKDGSLWKENGTIAWTNPCSKEVWEYNVEIAKEAAELGFDEIQFDYVRFPTGTGPDVDYGEQAFEKSEVINQFLKYAKKELDEYGVKVTADVFGIICESEPDGRNIGQVLESIVKDIDVICPMIYPSHFANETRSTMGNGKGQVINDILFKAPDLKPYDVVLNTLLKAKKRLSEAGVSGAEIRPYLQAFTAKYLPKGYYQHYGPKQIREQIKAVYDAGFDGWMLWNPGNVYPKEAFLPEK